MDILKKDKDNINEILYNTTEYANMFFSTLNDRPVSIEPYQLPDEKLPEIGIGANEVLKLFASDYANGLSGSNGSRYLGFVTGGATPAAIAGDWLASIFDQNVSTNESSIASSIEEKTIDMLKDLFNLDNEYSGAFVSGATMSNFVGLAQARQWSAQLSGINVTLDGLFSALPNKIISGKPHSSIYKASSMLGIGKHSIITIPCKEERESIDIQALEEALIDHNEYPCIVVANAGTVNTGDFDDLIAISELKRKYKFWLHVDAAFGGFASCSPKYKSLMGGINSADSITIDAHKWLNVPYDSALQFTKHRNIQLEVFENNAAYLSNSKNTLDYCNLTPENSRRFRALPTWFTLKAYGKKEYQKIVERNIDIAKQLGNRIEKSDHLRLLSQVHLNIVCFTLKSDKVTTNEVLDFLKKVNGKGQVFMTQTNYNGIAAIRAAFSNWNTDEQDLEIIWTSLAEGF
ncbi:pyridoxal phosphate-dependent decarboxylase family protein [Bacillus cereus]|uniref:pyridoxal phosphate-dependent decarboxylase family protein n=1 Tax=Bacillus cereus TaxID=1396 RepID=UPI000BF786D7|nr:aminotransferase class I/II-fold pyridoxal phosphate-dependent enzyme [Bacillus cereus]PFN12669.1 aspartate aminotransferase family protein [Bacillus cereus]